MLCNFYEEFRFSAKWITFAGSETVRNCALEFHRKFNYTCGAQPALLRIAAENYYVLWVNGQFAGRGPVRGTWGVNYFDCVDVTALLHEGENHIAVTVQSMNTVSNYNSYPAGCALLAEIPGVLTTDTSWHVRLMPGWINTEEFFTIQHGFRIDMDLRKTPGENWRSGEGSEAWPHAVIFTNNLLERKALRPRGIPELPATQAVPQFLKAAAIELGKDVNPADFTDFRKRMDAGKMTPVTATRHSDNSWCAMLPADQGAMTALFYDFGTPRIGYFDFTVEGENLDGVRLDVIYGEELWNNRLRTVYPLSIYSLTDTYYLRNGVNHIAHPFAMHGATMLQLNFSRNNSSAPQPVTVSNLRCVECRYPYGNDSAFRCSDPVLERLWELCRETMAACTSDVFMDCPWREHAFWVNDLVVENRSSLMLFGASDVHRHAFDVLFSQQFANGWIPGVAPDACTEDKPLNLLSPTMLFLFIIMEDYLMESADFPTVKRYLPNLKKVLDAVDATADETGLVQSLAYDSNFYDWGFEQNNITFNNARESMINSLYIKALKIYLHLCEETQVEEPDAAALRQRIGRVAKALRFFMETDAATGRKVLTDNAFTVDDNFENRRPATIRSELAQALAILSGELTAGETADLLKDILAGNLHRTELYLMSFVLQALAENGCAEEALTRIRNYWMPVIKHGATTVPEAAIYGYGREMFWESGSLCHGFATCPVDFFRSTILGIRPLKPGFKEFTVKPTPCGLDCASGKVFTPYGTIFVRWEKSDSGIRTWVECPPETKQIQ